MAPRDTCKLDLAALNEFSGALLGTDAGHELYAPFDTAPKAGSAEVYLHEMPGGQYTNLKEQAASMGLANRWPEIARTYAEVEPAFRRHRESHAQQQSRRRHDDVFLITRGIKPADVLNLEPGATPFPESVIDMLAGGLGQPVGGWPKKLQEVVLGKRKPIIGRPGENLPRVAILKKTKRPSSPPS